MEPMEQPILQTVKQQLDPEQTTCVNCGKDYPTQDALHRSVGDSDPVVEVLLVCPHCKFSLHVFYTSAEFEQRTQRLKQLFAKYRQSRKSQHLLEAQTAQAAYRRDFENFNSKLITKRKPITSKTFSKFKKD